MCHLVLEDEIIKCPLGYFEGNLEEDGRPVWNCAIENLYKNYCIGCDHLDEGVDKRSGTIHNPYDVCKYKSQLL